MQILKKTSGFKLKKEMYVVTQRISCFYVIQRSYCLQKTPVRYCHFAEHWTEVLRGKYEYVWNLIAICWSIWETEVVEDR